MRPQPIQIIEETDTWIAVNKPPFVPTIPERGKKTAVSIMAWAKEKWGEDIFLCHRLDRETSGILILAKTSEMHRNLSMQFEHRKVTKTYHAIVEGKIEFNQLLVDLPINTSDLNRIRIDHKNGKSAQTEFQSVELFKRFTLMECKPKTGRLHQIRVHLASQNARISADEKYGGIIPLLSHIKRKISGEDRPLIDRFALHAKSISFNVLNNTAVTVDCPYPKDYEVFLKLLRKYGS